MLKRVAATLITTTILCGLYAPVAVAQAKGSKPKVPAAKQKPSVEKPAAPAAAQVADTKTDYLARGIAGYLDASYEEALDDLTKAQAQDPASAAAAYYLGATFKKLQRFDRAIPLLKEAATRTPPFKQAYLELADTYYAVGRDDEALEALEASDRQGAEPSQTAFLKGLVLAKKRRYAEAEAAFERSGTLDPKLAASVDYQVAGIYYHQGKQAEARERFLRVAQRDPGSELGQMAQQQADAIGTKMAARKAFTASAGVSYQYDSNVVLKPDDSTSAEGIANAADTSTAVTLRAEYAPELRSPNGLKFQYSGYANYYHTLKAYNVQSHTVGIVPGRRSGDDSFSMPLLYSYTLVDKTGYLRTATVAPTGTFAVGTGQFAQVALKYQKKSFLLEPFTPDEDRNGTDIGAGLSWSYLIAEQKGYVSFRYEVDREKANGANWSSRGDKAGVSMQYPVTEAFRVTLGLETYQQRFDNKHTVFAVMRKDTTATGSVQAVYAVTAAIDLQLNCMTVKTTSSIPVYGYNKSVVGAGLNVKF